MRTISGRVLVAVIAVAGLALSACGGGSFDDLTAAGEAASVDPGPRTLDRADPRVQLRERAAEAAPAGVLEGSPTEDLVYTPIAPCRIVDTRSGTAVGGDLAAGETRSFYVTDFDDPPSTENAFRSQGGNPNGCGMLFGVATSVMVNFTVIGANGTGFMRAWATGTTEPNATILNFNQSLNVSNGIAVPICDPYTFDCDRELTVKGYSAKAHLVIDVVGFFAFSLPPGAVSSDTSTTSVDVNLANTPLACSVYLNLGGPALPQVEPQWGGDIEVDGHVTLTVAHTNGVEDRINLFVGFERRVGVTLEESPDCNQEPCVTETATKAVVSAAEATGTYSITVPVRCNIPVSADLALSAPLTYKLALAGLQATGGAMTVDRLAYTATFTPDWNA